MNAELDRTDQAKTIPPESDEQLMLAFGRGSTEAFSELFSRYQQPVFGFFHRRLAEAAQAEELTQETFLAVLRASSRYEPSSLFRTYLYAIALKILNAHRRKMTFRAMFFGQSSESRQPALESAAHAEVMLRQALAKLQAIEREIVLLREFEQLSYAEIAAVLRLPINTVRSRLFRARMTLRELFGAPVPKTTSELKPSEERI